MRETVNLIISGLKDINKALSKPVRFLIVSLVVASLSVVGILCGVVWWQRKDNNELKGQNRELRIEITSKDLIINGKNNMILEYLTNLNAAYKAEIEAIKSKK